MYERYCKLRDDLGLKDSILASALNITPSTFSDWKKGKSTPNADKLLKIARYLDTTVEYLMTGEEPHPADGVFYSKDEQELIGNYRILNDIGKASIKAYMTGIMQNPEMRRQKREESLPG